MPTMDESVRSHRQPRQAPSAFAPIASLRGLPNRSLEILHRTQGSVASFRRRNDRLALSPASARVVNRTERLARRPPQYRYFASTKRSRPMAQRLHALNAKWFDDGAHVADYRTRRTAAGLYCKVNFAHCQALMVSGRACSTISTRSRYFPGSRPSGTSSDPLAKRFAAFFASVSTGMATLFHISTPSRKRRVRIAKSPTSGNGPVDTIWTANLALWPAR